MGLSIRYGANPGPTQIGPATSGLTGTEPWGGTTVSPEEGSITQEGTFNPVTQKYVDDSWWSSVNRIRPNEYSVLQPNVDMPAPMYALPGSVNTGNELGSVYNPGAGGVMGDWQSSPNMFNMNPYVENFNAGFPTQMNPAYNIDNIVQPTFGGYPNQIGASNAPWVNPFGSMFGGIGNTGYQTRGNR